MFKLTQLVGLRPGIGPAERAKVVETLRKAQGGNQVVRAMLQPTLPGVYNGGDFIWHLQFADEAAYRACIAAPDWRPVDALRKDEELVAHIDSAAYGDGPSGARRPPLDRGVYRTLLLSVEKPVDEKTLRQFETELAAMPQYITSIANWQVSRVSEAAGSRKWTHVWEQEYADLSGLQGPYMMHPFHWAYIDRWFDPEGTSRIVDTFLCHTFCDFDGSMIAPG